MGFRVYILVEDSSKVPNGSVGYHIAGFYFLAPPRALGSG